MSTNVKFAKREGKKRKAFLTTIDSSEMTDELTEKDPKVVEWLLDSVQENLLFIKLDRAQRERVVNRMTLRKVKKGEELIKQGDKNATAFYVTNSGKFDILVDKVKVGAYSRGGCFGELALLYDAPRAATIIAKEDSEVYEVHRNEFRYEVANTYKAINKTNIDFLKKVELFRPLNNEELGLINDSLEEMTFEKGSIIVREGESGDKFYVIKHGQCKWTKSNKEEGILTESMFFGERALRTKEKRAATVEAHTKVTLLGMTSKDFITLLGPVIEIIDDKIVGYKRLQEMHEKKQNEKTGDDNDDNNDDNDGNNDSYNEEIIRDNVCELTELVLIGVLGKGAFGLVTLVEDPTSNKSYALKAIKKHQIIELGQQAHIISEKRVMEKMHNKFLVNLHCTYKDKLRVYFLLDACLGGELFTILRQRRYFDEPTAKFYTACVVQAFAYMHSKNIIYRDLKPENLVLDNDGYLKVTDFGFAKEVKDKTFTLCGTPDYLAPEIVTGQGHGKAVDWWTLGVLVYEMLASFPPFFDDEPIETYRKIIKGRVKFPRYFSSEGRDLIRGLLRQKPAKRLGILKGLFYYFFFFLNITYIQKYKPTQKKGGAENIRKHGWFFGFDWKKLNRGEIKAPIVNRVKNRRDLSNFVNSEEDEEDEEALPVDPSEDFAEEF